METLASTLTGIATGLFFVHLWRMRREEAYRRAGPLLATPGGFRRRAAILGFLMLGWLVFDSTRHTIASRQDPFGSFVAVAVCTFVVLRVFLNTSVVCISDAVWIELRERGVLSGANGRDTVLTPWHRIAYCQWLDSAGKLSIYSIEPFKVAASKRHAVTEILLTRTELRDPSGRVLNPDFVRPDPPPDDKTGPDRKPFQYELKTLLLLMTVVGSAMAWWATHVRAN